MEDVTSEADEPCTAERKAVWGAVGLGSPMIGSKIGDSVANEESVWIARLNTSAVARNRTGAAEGPIGVSEPYAGMIRRPATSNPPQYRRALRCIIHPCGRALRGCQEGWHTNVPEKSPSVFASGYQIPAPPPGALDRLHLRAQGPQPEKHHQCYYREDGYQQARRARGHVPMNHPNAPPLGPQVARPALRFD